ncbi:hypothetical protein A9Q87_02895 [Flavobacteriales bacterium 34_180_T64]|nr:hypothetical protein A9Q87_02895 [Flavobacteriales bacterium 34_180_T64]
MTTKSYIKLSLLCFVSFSFSQNMQKGFNYLETGQYREAESFFETILKDYPNDRTAKLCYGRAVGLSGNSEKSVSIFTELLNVYPNDFEIKLNYAESLLWYKNYTSAKVYYEGLISENNKSFPAILGYANTLSNLKIFDHALIYVDKALEISPGNKNALISKKYIYLGYANQYLQAQNYDETIRLLNKNLLLFENDTETLLNIANTYIISNRLNEAETTYKTITTTSKDSIVSLNGLALVAHLKGKEKEAMQLSELAYNTVSRVKDSALSNQTKERYIQALIWNRKFKKSEQLIDYLITDFPNENWVLALRATLNIYKSDFKKSITDYSRILENDSTSFDGNLGKANALKALGLYDKAYQYADKTLDYYTNQKDAVNFIKALNTNFTPFLDVKTPYNFDNGNNEAFSFITNIAFPLSTKFQLLTKYSYRKTSNSITNIEATSNAALFGLSYQVLPAITFKGIAGTISAKTDNDNYTQLLADLSFNIKPYKLQVIDIGYKRELQNFNAELLGHEIVQNNFYLNYNLSTNFKLGWFMQYYYTSQTDNNYRNLFFTSLYYNFLNKPILKAGFNYQYITFKNQVPDLYFSPKKFKATELFVNFLKDELTTESNDWFYELTAASGFQFIEDDDKQWTYRFQGEFGYKFSNRCIANLYGLHSNIASATATGFTFTEIGLRFKWYFFSQPIFMKTKKAKEIILLPLSEE